MEEKRPNPLKKSASTESQADQAANAAVEEFFNRLNHDMRNPKPGQDPIAAALQAIQDMGVETGTDEAVEHSTEGRTCAVCGATNRKQNRFCSSCGGSLQDAPVQAHKQGTKPAADAPGQHHYHHHYHYFSGEGGMPMPGEARPASAAPARDAGRMRVTPGGPALSRAEAAVRKVTQDWALACNTKQLDDLVSLYATDAVLLRPNLVPVRGMASVREFFISALDSGFGDVEMEALRVELFGDTAYEAGRCKMLVPMAMGKRREERGKYLMVYVRQPNGDWKVVADCWSTDSTLKAGETPEPPRPMLRKP